MSSLGTLGSFVGWMFLPGMVTGWIQSFLYRLFIRAGDPIPSQGTPRFVRDYRRIYVSVILAYLLFTIYEVWHNITQQGNFYHLLGVDINVDDRTLKKRFRALTMRYHPDKAGPESEPVFMMLKGAFDTISDPMKRFAYERIGPSILESEWKLCHTYSDYLTRAAMQIWPGYVGSLIFLVVLGGLGKLEFGKYWRFFFLSSMFFFEYAVITRPHFLLVPRIISIFTRRTLLPYEQLLLARQLLMTSFIALSQLGPVLSPPKPTNENAKYALQLERLQACANVTESIVSKWTAMELAPFVDEQGEVSGEVKTKMKDFLLQEKLRSHPEVRDAMGRVIQKRREHGPNLKKT